MRANNMLLDVILANFPMMNFNDLISTPKLMGDLNKSQILDKAAYIIEYGHIKAFLDAYFVHLALIDNDLSIIFNKRPEVPNDLLKGKMNNEDFEYGEIIHKPLGVEF